MKVLAEWSAYRLAFRRPLATSGGSLRERRGWILVLRDGDGAEGFGEAAPIHWSDPGALELVEGGVATVSGALPVADWDGVDEIAAWVAGIVGARKLAVEIGAALQSAALDLTARRRGVAVAELLAPGCHRTVTVNALLSASDPDEIVREARDLIEGGARCIKLKVGASEPERDVACISALLDSSATGGEVVTLRLDANRGWSFDVARQVLDAIAPERIEYIEEPLAEPSHASLARLRTATAHRIAVDESLEDLGGVDALAVASCSDAVVLKPSRQGGILNALATARKAAAAGLSVSLTDSIETAIGQAAVVHLTAALGGPVRPVGLGGRWLARQESVASAHAPRASRAYCVSASGPGLSLRDASKPLAGAARAARAAGVELASVSAWWLGETAARAPASVALHVGGACVSYRDLADAAREVARLLAAHGVRSGDCVSIWARASLDFVAAVHAIQFVRAVVHPLAVAATDREVDGQLSVTRPRILLAGEEYEARAASAAARIGARVVVIGARPSVGATTQPRSAEASPLSRAALLSTSGTTGTPKAVSLLRRSLHSSTAAAVARLGFAPGQTWLCVLPLHHVGGFSMLTRAAIVGAAVVLRDRFDADEFCRDITRFDVSHTSVVPTMLHRLLTSASAASGNATIARCQWLVGGAGLSDALASRAVRMGLDLRATYGMTEAASQIATCEHGELDAHPGTVGRPLDGLDVEIVRPGRDGFGDIVVAGPQLFAGYENDAPATGAALANGRLRTGDIGRIDREGRLYVASRRSDLVVSGGENVYPREIESLLEQHPAVSEAAVFGEVDAEWGQRVVAVVVPRDGARIEAGELIAWCRERVSVHKIPKRIESADALPRSSSGKLERSRLGAPARDDDQSSSR